MRNILLYSSLVENLRKVNGRRRGRDEEYLALQFIGGEQNNSVLALSYLNLSISSKQSQGLSKPALPKPARQRKSHYHRH